MRGLWSASAHVSGEKGKKGSPKWRERSGFRGKVALRLLEAGRRPQKKTLR